MAEVAVSHMHAHTRILAKFRHSTLNTALILLIANAPTRKELACVAFKPINFNTQQLQHAHVHAPDTVYCPQIALSVTQFHHAHSRKVCRRVKGTWKIQPLLVHSALPTYCTLIEL